MSSELTMADLHERPAPTGVPRRLTAAAIVGNTIEFYDFTIYGTMTAIVFNEVFFPDLSPSVGTLLAFMSFAVGFLSRPLGGVIFGNLGDRIGRKPMLVWSLSLMGGATFLMGLLPSHASVGIWAPILLTILRFCQGLGIGGEWGGAVSLMVESAPASRRGWYGSLVQSGSGLGLILSGLTVTGLLTVLSSDQLLAWGWRIPFLVSVILVGVGLVVRLNIDESPEFQRVQSDETTSRSPLWESLREHRRTVGLAIGMYAAIAAFGFLMGVFVVSYVVNELGMSRSVAVNANLLSAVFYLAATLIAGRVSDRLGRRRTYLMAGLLLIPTPFVVFALLDTRVVVMVFLASIVGNFVGGLPYGVQASLFCELFPTRVRYSGISVGFQVATVLGGALAPTMASLLLGGTGTSWSVAAYISVLAVVMVLCTLAIRPLQQQPAHQRQGVA